MKNRFIYGPLAVALLTAFTAACAEVQTPAPKLSSTSGMKPLAERVKIMTIYDNNARPVLRKNIGKDTNFTCPHDNDPVISDVAGVHSTGFTTIVVDTAYVDSDDAATAQKLKQLEDAAPETVIGFAPNGQTILKGKFSEINYNDNRQLNMRLKLDDGTPLHEIKTCGLQILATKDPSAITPEALNARPLSSTRPMQLPAPNPK